MTIAALTQRLLRYWKVDDLSGLAADDALSLVDAINGSLQEAYSMLPAIYSQKRFVAGIDAPKAATLTTTDTSTAFSGLSEVSGTLRIEGDAALNQIESPGTLAMPYAGASGSHSAILYDDSLPLVLDVVRVLTGPVLETGETLEHGKCNPQQADTVGRPTLFSIEASAHEDPPFWMRLWPLPDKRYRLEWTAEVRPPRISIRKLSSNDPVPFNDRMIESCLLPLAALRMIFSPRWDDPNQRNAVVEAAGVARELMLRAMPANVSSAPNTLATPFGY